MTFTLTAFVLLYFWQFWHLQLLVGLLLMTLIVTWMPCPVAAAAPVGIKAANAGNDEHPDNESEAEMIKPIHFI